MNEKKRIKIIFFTIIMFIILLICPIKVNANIDIVENTTVQISSSGMGEIFGGVENFEQAGLNLSANSVTGSITSNDENLRNVSNIIYNTFFIIGIIIVVIVGLVIGMKFMTGSVEQKAEIKQTLPPYILGCIIIFGAFGIWRLVVNILNQTQI